LRSTLTGIVLLIICLPPGLAQTQGTAGLVIAPTRIDFGSQAISSQSALIAITISNRASVPVTLEEILASGIDFSAQNNCGKQLAPGAECSIQISFKPAIPGDRTGILQITASDSANSHFVPLTGKGTNQ
jgi:Abnormal spindle-like microcephaly-assoc'd, ASPM-SPD-2-Hydin